MKKFFQIILSLTIAVIMLITSAIADGKPVFTRQPVDSVTDSNGNLSLSFKGENYNQNDSSWYFVDPDTGNTWTGPQLRDEMKKRNVSGFSLTAQDQKQFLFLQNVPQFMHGWEVYVILANKNGKTESDHFHIYWYGLEQNKEKGTVSTKSENSSASTKDGTFFTVKKTSGDIEYLKDVVQLSLPLEPTVSETWPSSTGVLVAYSFNEQLLQIAAKNGEGLRVLYTWKTSDSKYYYNFINAVLVLLSMYDEIQQTVDEPYELIDLADISKVSTVEDCAKLASIYIHIFYPDQ